MRPSRFVRTLALGAVLAAAGGVGNARAGDGTVYLPAHERGNAGFWTATAVPDLGPPGRYGTDGTVYLPAHERGSAGFWTTTAVPDLGPPGRYGTDGTVYLAAHHRGNAGFWTASAAPVEVPRGPNQPPPGFKALFNGRDLANWQGLIDVKRRATLTPEQRRVEQEKADALARAHWSVKDGVLVFDGKGQSLQTAKDYGDFELYVDWKIEPKGDSGIYVRGNPQIQIWDNPIGSGGLFNNQRNPSKPLVVADRPVGEWNTFWIRMVGDRVWVKLNDQLVVDNTPLENYWERGKPLPATGPIELQNHGNTLYFRNIFIRELK